MDSTLQRLLEDDPLGKLFAAVDEVDRPFNDHLNQQYPGVRPAFDRAREIPDLAAKLDLSTESNIRRSADLLDLKFSDLRGYLDLSKSLREEWAARRKEAVKYGFLRRSGAALMHRSPVTKVKDGRMPDDGLKPYIMYWSGDWCFPCQLTKPTFARLAHFFDRCRLFYCADDELRRSQRIRFVPCLAVYLPDGSSVTAPCGGTALELWENLNALLTLGQNFRGEGMLVCDEQGCRIEQS